MIRWPQGVFGRTVLAVLLVVVVAVVLYTVVVVRTAFANSAHAFRELADPVPEAILDRCESDPASFVVRSDRWEAWAYDRKTLRSANPDAPSVDPLAAALMNTFGLEFVRAHRHRGYTGVMGWETGRTGPCSFVTLSWDAGTHRVARVGAALLVAMLLITAGGTFVGIFFVVRPLVRRVNQLADAGAAVGTEAYRSAGASDDDLGVLAGILDVAHARVQAEQAREAERRKALERHLADVAHDLRTPLSSLQLRLESLPADDTVQGALDDVLYVTMLMQNLSLSAHLEGVHDTSDARTDLSEVIRRVIRRFAVIGRRKGLEVDGAAPDEPLLVATEAVHAEQAVANLVHNAIVHHQGPGHVAVVLEAHDGRFSLRVVDDGPGIPEERLARLMKRHTQGPQARTRHADGQGLGLAIVGEVCTRAGWTLTFSSPPDRGLRVHISGLIATS